ncbi:MAG: AAA family ATPase [Tenericutes bacterium]|nr:MAG: AAA family ATPase [Mycoplasmatota bacterium]
MAVSITNTKVTSGKVKALVYGRPGIGKTMLASTAPKPLIISAEAGLLSLADHDIPVAEISSMADLTDIYNYVKDDPDAQEFETIVLDSISEIAEVILSANKKTNKDPRAAYGQTNDEVASLIRGFRDLKNFHVYFVAKEGKVVDDATGLTSYFPSMPGKTLTQSIGYFFDEVLVMRLGKTESGASYRYLQTAPDLQYEAKDRSGKLNMITKPDLGVVFKKILRKKVAAEDSTIKAEEISSDAVEDPGVEEPLVTEQEK